jgi:hypothetical protein
MPSCWTDFIFHWLKSMHRAKSSNSANLGSDTVLALTRKMASVITGRHSAMQLADADVFDRGA